MSGFSQDQISAARIMVVGCGALGSEVLKNLILMGVIHITVIDFDVVEIGNLSRSILFSKADAEQRRYKVDVVAERLRQINPAVEIRAIRGDISCDVGLRLISRMDVIVGCVDSRWARYHINRLAMRAGVPWIDGAIGSFEGTARVFAPGVNCYACSLGPEGLSEMRRRMPCQGIIQRQEKAGHVPVTSIVASVIGAIQVQEALKLVVKDFGTSLCGRMLYYDGEHMTVRTVEYKAFDDECPEHEMWAPVRATRVHRGMTVKEALDTWSEQLLSDSVTLRLDSDCYVDYVVRKDNDQRRMVMLPGRRVEQFVELDRELMGMLRSGLYQHEYRHIDRSFPYQELTLKDLGIPDEDVLRVEAEGKEYFFGLRSEV